ncbi:MAG: glycosyltransferase family 39 protein [Anaerolineae bacterium]|nr:glycosyltransferase family 39 protein [Anaerolineae bacterium]
MSNLRPHQRYLIIVCFLLLFFGLRIFRLDALPFFIDESLIVQWSAEVRSRSPLGFGYHGKYLLAWVTAGLGSVEVGYWTTRVVTLFFVMLGASALVRLGQRLHRWRSGVLALFLMTWTPMLIFFDRLALTDTVLHAMLTLFMFFLIHTCRKKKIKIKHPILVALTFLLALLAKSTAIVLLPMPLVAVILLPTWSRQRRMRVLLLIYGAILAFWLPLQIVLMLRDINYFGLAGQFSVGLDRVPLTVKLQDNTAFIVDGLRAYFGDWFFAVVAVSYGIALLRMPRRALTLLAMIGGLSLAIILAGGSGLSIRYWLAMIPTALVLLIIGLEILFDTFPSPIKNYGLPLLLVAYMVIIGIPFLRVAYTAPQELPLPGTDRLSYIESDAAGTMLPEVAQFIDASDIRVTVGAFPQCFTLNLYMTSEIQCVNVLADNGRMQRVNQRLTVPEPPYYVVLESPGYVTLQDITVVDLTPIATFERRGGLITIVIYEVSP